MAILLRIKFLLLLSVSVFMAACDAPPEGPSAVGEYDVCRVDDNLENDGYGSARIHYPCNLDDGPFPITTVTGGYLNNKEQMSWLSSHFASHGFITIALTPTTALGSPPVWAEAHKAGVEQLLAENRNSGNRFENTMDENAIGLMGFSFGGAGALLAAEELGDSVQVVMALAPVIGEVDSLTNVTASTLVVSGTLDNVARPSEVRDIYDGLDAVEASVFALLLGSTHADGINLGDNHNKIRTLMTSWLKVNLVGDESYATYLSGDKHNEHEEDDWFREYEFVMP